MPRLTILLALFASVALAWAAPDMAASPVVVTVTGAIETTNRGAYDPFRDALFAVVEEPFEAAFTMTREDLAALPQHEAVVQYPNWPVAARVRGPRLDAVLDAAGATGSEVLVQAVDGYAPSFTMAEISGGSFILAIENDGRPLGIGGRGPTWLVFPPGSYEGQDEDGDSGLAWAVFHLKVTAGE